MKLEQEVDVFHTVQHVRTTRSQLITDLVSARVPIVAVYNCIAVNDVYNSLPSSAANETAVIFESL